ncbi:hypothetical protein [Magnetospirillum sp. 15-1]|uniref:hypothetical protein n=1 Tax=Magnetospirillum sp. 15-1 TaxID=1979370 RepID=UPI000BBBAE1F|nr:hypothetical protein [Magnetospirillum sp. 15-1]
MTPSDQLSVFFTSGEFGHVAGLKARAAILALSRAHSGKTWRGHTLSVIAQRGRGGASGLSYLVRIDSLPPELRIRAEAMFGTVTDDDDSAPLALSAPATATSLTVQNQVSPCLPAISASTAAATREWEWKREIIHPAMILPKGSPGRGAMIKELSSRGFLVPGGGYRTFSESTLRGWLNGYEAKGIVGLCRKPRADRGEDRVVISRAWDDGVPFSAEAKVKIAAKLVTYVKSVWAAAGGGKGKGAAKGGGGWKICCRLATKELIKLTRAAGLDLPTAHLLALCEVPRGFVEPHRNYAIIALKDKDAKGFFDTAAPRTRRTRDGMVPMELVVGDVHHLDIYLRREDGSLFTPKIIAWCDIATNRIRATLHFVPKGKGIRQEDVISSFIEMTQDPAWGMPQALYLDNGGEYSKLGFVDDAMKLASLAQCQGFRLGNVTDDPEISALAKRAANARRKMVVNAQPYNAPAKPIEGLFAVLEGGAFAMVPGWIGGNRMTAKTKNVGREPTPFEGSEADFRQALATSLDYYETTAQGGSLKGKSPREAFTIAVNAGWMRTDVDPMALHAVFATRQPREVMQGEFTYKGTSYRAHELLKLLPGSKVTICVPHVGDRNRIPVLDEDGSFLCIAEQAPLYGFLDPAGAKDRGRRVRAQNKAITAMAREVDDLDLVAEMGEASALHLPAPIPESAGTIRLSDDMEAIAQATKQLPALRAEAQDPQYRERLARRATLERLAAAG